MQFFVKRDLWFWLDCDVVLVVGDGKSLKRQPKPLGVNKVHLILTTCVAYRSADQAQEKYCNFLNRVLNPGAMSVVRGVWSALKAGQRIAFGVLDRIRSLVSPALSDLG